MSVLYTVITRGTTVLCEYGDENLRDLIKKPLTKIKIKDHQDTIRDGDYFFHYICADQLIYMCISDSKFPKQRALVFLSGIKYQFSPTYDLTDITAEYTGFSPVIKTNMKFCNTEIKVNELKDIMVDNIKKLNRHDEQLKSLDEIADNLQNSATTFLQIGEKLPQRVLKSFENKSRPRFSFSRKIQIMLLGILLLCILVVLIIADIIIRF